MAIPISVQIACGAFPSLEMNYKNFPEDDTDEDRLSTIF
jgi:hypothetical protein